MGREEELLEIFTEARDELDDIRTKRVEEENTPLVGKYFKYRNSYGGGSEGWWLYARVDNVSGSSISATTFEKTSSDIFEAQTKSWWSKHDGYMEINELEFMMAWDKFTKELLALV